MWSNRLRTVLQFNAATSLVGGTTAAVAPGWVNDLLGLDHVTLVRVVGIALVMFAVGVATVAFGSNERLLSRVRLVSAADASWVAATVGVVALGVLSTSGIIVAVVVALAVADFGIAQMWMRAKALR